MIGRIEGESNTRLIIPNEQLSNYTVNIYYTNSTDVTRKAEDKIELIGTTGLQEVIVDGEIQYVFELVTPQL